MTDKPDPTEVGKTGAEATTHTPEETQALIKKLREEAKQNRLAAEATAAKLLERQRLDEEREQNWLKEQGEFKTLYERTAEELKQQKTAAEQAAAYRDAFKASLDARIQAIPEGMRSLVPEGLDPLALSQWLDKNSALLSNRRAPSTDAGAGGTSGGSGASGGPQPTQADVDLARAMGIPIERYMARKAEVQRSRGQ